MAYTYYTHQDYRTHYDEISKIPSRFETEGVVIYNRRNCIKVMDVCGVKWNVKSFKTPNFINSIIYQHFRQPKALRSLNNAAKLLKMGINTPQPIACIIEQELIGIEHSYYISQHIDYDYTLGELFAQNPPNIDHILTQCLLFIHDFHCKGVYFLDLSVGNILIKKQGNNQYVFYLVDLNRMKFFDRPLSCSERIKAFCRLDATPELKHSILKKYAQISAYGFDEVMEHYTKHYKREKLRKLLKKLSLHNIFNNTKNK